MSQRLSQVKLLPQEAGTSAAAKGACWAAQLRQVPNFPFFRLLKLARKALIAYTTLQSFRMLELMNFTLP